VSCDVVVASQGADRAVGFLVIWWCHVVWSWPRRALAELQEPAALEVLKGITKTKMHSLRNPSAYLTKLCRAMRSQGDGEQHTSAG
jgi:hypothetical protein